MVEPAPESGRMQAPPARALRRGRVLVIDDDDMLLQVIGEFLGASGYEVETAPHGLLAEHLAGHHRPDVVLLDIRMPALDGYAVLSLMRRHPQAREIPVVACTALASAGDQERIRAAGFDGYVKKPIDFQLLLRTVSRLVR